MNPPDEDIEDSHEWHFLKDEKGRFSVR